MVVHVDVEINQEARIQVFCDKEEISSRSEMTSARRGGRTKRRLMMTDKMRVRCMRIKKWL